MSLSREDGMYLDEQFERLHRRLLGIERRLHIIQQTEEQQSMDISRAISETAQLTDVTEAAVALLTQLEEEVRNTGGDQAAADRLADEIAANRQTLAAALAANTPAETPFVNARIPSDTSWEDYKQRLFIYNQSHPTAQIPEDQYVTEEAWNNTSV